MAWKITESMGLTNLTWLEQEEIKLRQEEIDKVKDVKNSVLEDLESIKLEVNQYSYHN